MNNTNNIVIGIEGLVGAGKTSTCKSLLKKIPNSVILHGGNLYRAIVYALIKLKSENKSLETLENSLKNIDIKKLMDELKVKIEIENRETVIYVNGKKIEDEELQSKDNSLAVSVAGKTANNSNLYSFAKILIDMYKEKFNVIVSGRDLMQIYPNLNYHFLITASLDERVRRKCIQYNDKYNYDEIKENIMKRDKLQEESGYYKKYENTIEIDVTECNNADESANKVFNYIKEYSICNVIND